MPEILLINITEERIKPFVIYVKKLILFFLFIKNKPNLMTLSGEESVFLMYFFIYLKK